MGFFCLVLGVLWAGEEEKRIGEGQAGEAGTGRPQRIKPYALPDHPVNRNALPEISGTGPFNQRYLSARDQSLLDEEAINQPLTQRYLTQYTSAGGLSWLSSVTKRGAPYSAFIRREVAREDLPQELAYLPVIESGYLPTAMSRSGAAGLWQFMKNSIAPFDIRITDWVDERMDFWKSTQGALRKLKENYTALGDWYLALAAYNAGLGGVKQIIRNTGINDYWTLSEKKLLKIETIHYVPKLLAAACILSNPRRFGLEELWTEDPRWERVPVHRSVDLSLLAVAAGIDPGELKQANRELQYNITPPGMGYLLKVPRAAKEAVETALEKKDLPLINYYMHTIRSGDTLLALAIHYGTPVDHILFANPGLQPKYLRIGARLMIPAFKTVEPYTRRTGSDEITFTGTHLVKRGESLWSIALAYNVDPEQLAQANGMELNDILREGRNIKTPIKR